MTTTTNNTRDEIIEYVDTNYQGSRLGTDYEDITELVDDILAIIVKKLDNKIKFCDQEMKKPENIAVNDCLGCIESKKKAFQEVISMLVKK